MEVFGRLSAADRSQAVEILNRRLRQADLRAAVDALESSGRKKSVEALVVEAERGPASGRRRTKLEPDELAEFLVDRCGLALLESEELRRLLALRASDSEREVLHDYEHGAKSRGGALAQAKAIGGRSWHAGKSWSRHFVRALDLPRVFAGLPGLPSEPNTLNVAPFVPLPELKDFQADLRDQAIEVLRAGPGKNRAVLTLPTGAGKTRTAVESLVTWRLSQSGRPVLLWIAQSAELCEQAVQSFREVWTDLGHRPEMVRSNLEIGRFWGGSAPVPEDPDVVVASIQKLLATVREQDSEKRAEFTALTERIGAVVVDEAHRIDADSYREVLGTLNIEFSPSASSELPLLGLTATPFRSVGQQTQRMVRMFHNQLLHADSLGEDPIAALRARRVLAEAEHEILEHSAAFDMTRNQRFVEHFDQFGEFDAGFLRVIAESEARNRALFDRLMEIPAESPTLFFGCTVEHAEAMSILLRREGRSAEVVTGKTRAATRRALIEEFRAKNISVLCNFGVLTTGFDAPKVQAVVIGRPTTSRVLYEQMIGRGLRGPLFNGTETCTVVDVRDHIKFQGELAYRKYLDYWTPTGGCP